MPRPGCPGVWVSRSSDINPGEDRGNQSRSEQYGTAKFSVAHGHSQPLFARRDQRAPGCPGVECDDVWMSSFPSSFPKQQIRTAIFSIPHIAAPSRQPRPAGEHHLDISKCHPDAQMFGSSVCWHSALQVDGSPVVDICLQIIRCPIFPRGRVNEHRIDFLFSACPN